MNGMSCERAVEINVLLSIFFIFCQKHILIEVWFFFFVSFLLLMKLKIMKSFWKLNCILVDESFLSMHLNYLCLKLKLKCMRYRLVTVLYISYNIYAYFVHPFQSYWNDLSVFYHIDWLALGRSSTLNISIYIFRTH